MVELKSPENGAKLIFSVVSRYDEGTDFYVELNCPFGSARTTSSTYHYGSPAEMFRPMAQDWKGWDGEKSWNDLENSLHLRATSDSTGHIRMEVTLYEYESKFQTILVFHAGQLEKMADELGTLLP